MFHAVHEVVIDSKRLLTIQAHESLYLQHARSLIEDRIYDEVAKQTDLEARHSDKRQ
jgi:NAD-dependent DNA ligase